MRSERNPSAAAYGLVMREEPRDVNLPRRDIEVRSATVGTGNCNPICCDATCCSATAATAGPPLASAPPHLQHPRVRRVLRVRQVAIYDGVQVLA